MPDGAFDFVLFDLGGVLIELGGVATMQGLTGIALDDELWMRWLTSPWVRTFEKGECSADAFAVGIVTEWIGLTPGEFLEVFRDWPIGPFPGAPDVLDEVQRSVPIGCLSNTNALHWDHQSAAWPMLGLFDRRFLSFASQPLGPSWSTHCARLGIAELAPVGPETDDERATPGAQGAGWPSMLSILCPSTGWNSTDGSGLCELAAS